MDGAAVPQKSDDLGANLTFERGQKPFLRESLVPLRKRNGLTFVGRGMCALRHAAT